MPLQNHLGSLALVRLLQEWAPAPAEPSRQDTAERLGDWLSPVASVQLDGALQAIASYGVARERKAGGPGGVPFPKGLPPKDSRPCSESQFVRSGPLGTMRVGLMSACTM